MICDTTTLHLLCKLAQSIDEIFTDKRIFLLRPTQQLKEKKKKYLWYVTQRSIFYITLSWHDGSMKFYEEGTPRICWAKILRGNRSRKNPTGRGYGKMKDGGLLSRVDACEQSITNPSSPRSSTNQSPWGLHRRARFVFSPSLCVHHKGREDTSINQPLFPDWGRRRRRPIFSDGIMRSKIRCITHESRAFKCFNWFPLLWRGNPLLFCFSLLFFLFSSLSSFFRQPFDRPRSISTLISSKCKGRRREKVGYAINPDRYFCSMKFFSPMHSRRVYMFMGYYYRHGTLLCADSFLVRNYRQRKKKMKNNLSCFFY